MFIGKNFLRDVLLTCWSPEQTVLWVGHGECRITEQSSSCLHSRALPAHEWLKVGFSCQSYRSCYLQYQTFGSSRNPPREEAGSFPFTLFFPFLPTFYSLLAPCIFVPLLDQWKSRFLAFPVLCNTLLILLFLQTKSKSYKVVFI